MHKHNFSFTFINFFTIICLLTYSANTFVCTEALYEDYLTHWQRNFTQEKSNPDYNSKFDAYCQNRAYVDDINSQNLTYDLDIYWQWMQKTDDQRNQIVKVQFTPQAIAATAVNLDDGNSQIRKVSATLPDHIDYRQTNKVSSIKSQGSCGCCWSFTTVGTYQSWMMLKGQKQYDLSEQYILECTTKFTQNVKKQNLNSTCGGGYIDFAGELARVNGIPSEDKYPYIASTYAGLTFPTTSGICSANQTYMYAQNPNVTTFGVSRNVSSNDKMKQLIANGPVAALIYAQTDFQAYKSGVFSGCPSTFSTSYSKINHAVVIIGYDVNGNYIIKNSWGTAWGDNGFGVVSKDRDCGLSAYAFQYSSDAAPGNGVLFYKQVDLNWSSGSYLGGLVCLLMMILIVIN